jgi:NAD(P)-dependent dehydrogenase (short-subunit alcohol dehydrogenase family)
MIQVVLVTGASSGIGRAIAQRFAERGWRVFGTDPLDAAAAASGTVRGLVLDVRDDASVADAVATALGEAGRIDVLVNNAGLAVVGPLEEISVEQAIAQFDVNLFGVLRVTNAVLPVMRRQGAGRIVNVGSLAGLLPLPYMGIYSASKHALEGYSGALASEVGGFGIRVALVEPGFIRTAIDRAAITGVRRLDAYDAIRDRALSGIVRAVAEGNDPGLAADAVWRAATARRPRMRYPVGRGAALAGLLRAVLPHAVLAWNARRSLHVESFKPLKILRRRRSPS